jgi:RNA polymerase sigma-70 factor (ECF subfamily)
MPAGPRAGRAAFAARFAQNRAPSFVSRRWRVSTGMTISLVRAATMTTPPIAPAQPLPDDALERELVLVRRARDGDRAAADRLATESYQKLFASCCRMTGNPETAADLVQESYRKAWQSLAGFRGDSRFSTWLFRIAFTTHLKQVRRPRLVVPMTPETEAGFADPEPSPEQEAARRQRGEQLRHAVALLPDELRFAVTAHYWAELPVAEIAAAEGLTPMGVRKRLARAFRQIAATLQEGSR